MLFALYLSQRTRCLYLLHLLKFDLVTICSRQLPSGLRGLKFCLRFYLHPLCACSSSKGSGETARMLKHLWAFIVPKVAWMYFPTIVYCFNNMPRFWEDSVLITCGTSKTPRTKTRTDTKRAITMWATANNHNNIWNHALEPTSVAATIWSGMQEGGLNIFYFIEYAF